MTTGGDGLVLPPDAGKTLLLRGTRVEYKMAGSRLSGGPTVLEFIAAPGFSTGAHIHRTIEELFYVVEGEFELRVGDETYRARAGTFASVPPSVAHGFGNPGTTPARLLLTISPAGVHERYFEELAAILAKDGPPDAAAIAELRQRYDTEQLASLSA
jgi:quercetin dioxygenase-like cupin family protein